MNLSLFQPPQIELPSARPWAYGLALRLLPVKIAAAVPWANANYRVMTNDAEYFDATESPQIIEPLQHSDDPGITAQTLVKPVQTAGTSFGEIALFRRILTGSGLIGYYWPTNDKARDRWEKFTEKRLKACRPIRASMPELYEDCFIKFPNITFAMQGVFTSGNLDSDTVDFIVAEEVHQWEAGMLGKAKGRQTRVAFPKFIVISNGGLKGDQLHQQYNEGTQQQFEIKCPGCGNYHIMRTRWEDNRPELGGLRYDSDGCKRPDGTFDYNKLVPTIRFQMPCGYEMRDDIRARRAAAQAGRYSEPFNAGALLSNRSYTYQAVCCHNIRWLDLIMEKHQALRSLKAGDDTDFRRYMQEREAVFYDPGEHRPFQGQVIISSGTVMNRTGLPDELGKIWAADWQQGFKHLGELTHYWLVIESVLPNCSSQVIYAGKVSDENELLGILKDHNITDGDGGGLCDGFVDASKNTKHILSFCYRAGINAVVGGDQGQRGFRWPDGSTQYYSMKKFIYKELNMPPRYELIPTREGYVEDPAEPFIIRYNKAGLLKNHFFLREMKANILANHPRATPEDYIERIVPEDIGDDYLKHHEAWERDLNAKAAKKMGEVEGFKQVARADHLMSCTTYIDLMKDLTGLLGNRLAQLGIERQNTEGTK